MDFRGDRDWLAVALDADTTYLLEVWSGLTPALYSWVFSYTLEFAEAPADQP